MAKTVLQSAWNYLPQAQEVRTILSGAQVNCTRSVELINNLANAPRYKDMDKPLWDRRGRTGIEGELWNIKDSYADAVNQFNVSAFVSIRNTCAAGSQPTVKQRQDAVSWMDMVGVVGKLEGVINKLAPAVGP